jgi:ABC-type branched-subunit amino acid transport system substrate-binding protein
MTSVLSHQLLLSGNSVVLFLLIVIMSCGGSKTITTKTPIDTIPKEIVKVKDTIIPEKKIEMVIEKKEEVIVNSNPFKNATSAKKSKYKIAFILPFSNYEIMRMDLSKIDGQIPRETKQALQYWEGIQLALDNKWKGKNIQLEIEVYDNKKQDSTTEKILKDVREFRPDVIIAPFHTRQASIVADYALEHKTPCFLPYNPSDKVSNNNPYLFKINSSLFNIYKKIYLQELSTEDSSIVKFHFVFKDNIKTEYDLAKSLEKYTNGQIDTNQTKVNRSSKVINFMVVNKGMRYADNLLKERKNILFFPSAEDRYVNTLLGNLSDQKSQYKVYGTPSWEQSELIEKSTFEKVEPMIYGDYYVSDSTLLSTLNKQYIKRIGETMSDDVVRGYDFMNFLAENLNKHGMSMFKTIQENTYRGLGSIYRFKPVIDKKGNIDNFSNDAEYILQYRDGQWGEVEDNK